MNTKDCSECARLREQSATLYAEYVATRDDLTVTRKGDSHKTAEVKRVHGLWREACRRSHSHRDSHKPVDSE